MDKTNKSFEDIIQQKLEDARVHPTPGVLRNIKRKLFIADFFSLNYRKFNIGYVSVLILAAITAPLLITEQDKSFVAIEKEKDDSNRIFDEKSLVANESGKTIETKSITQVESSESKDKMRKLTALYKANAVKGCAPLTIHFQNKSANANKYNWDFGNGEKSVEENPKYTFNEAGVYRVKLTTKNVTEIEATYIQTIKVFDKPDANFKIEVLRSDINTKEIVFDNHSKYAKSYKWSFGDNTFSDDVEPKHVYEKFGTYNVRLVTISENGCVDTLIRTNSFIAKDYRLVFPDQFKPNIVRANNGDYKRPENKSFVFYPQNFGAKEYHLVVTTTSGVEVFSSSDITKGWDGYVRGRLAPPGVYSYKSYGVYPNDKEFSLSGNVKLVVDKSYQNFNNN